MQLCALEGKIVLNFARCSLQRTRLQLKRHEDLLRHVVNVCDAETYSGREAETLVVAGVPQHNHGSAVELAALIEAGPHERGAESLRFFVMICIFI